MGLRSGPTGQSVLPTVTVRPLQNLNFGPRFLTRAVDGASGRQTFVPSFSEPGSSGWLDSLTNTVEAKALANPTNILGVRTWPRRAMNLYWGRPEYEGTVVKEGLSAFLNNAGDFQSVGFPLESIQAASRRDDTFNVKQAWDELGPDMQTILEGNGATFDKFASAPNADKFGEILFLEQSRIFAEQHASANGNWVYSGLSTLSEIGSSPEFIVSIPLAGAGVAGEAAITGKTLLAAGGRIGLNVGLTAPVVFAANARRQQVMNNYLYTLTGDEMYQRPIDWSEATADGAFWGLLVAGGLSTAFESKNLVNGLRGIARELGGNVDVVGGEPVVFAAKSSAKYRANIKEAWNKVWAAPLDNTFPAERTRLWAAITDPDLDIPYDHIKKFMDSRPTAKEIDDYIDGWVALRNEPTAEFVSDAASMARFVDPVSTTAHGRKLAEIEAKIASLERAKVDFATSGVTPPSPKTSWVASKTKETAVSLSKRLKDLQKQRALLSSKLPAGDASKLEAIEARIKTLEEGLSWPTASGIKGKAATSEWFSQVEKTAKASASQIQKTIDLLKSERAAIAADLPKSRQMLDAVVKEIEELEKFPLENQAKLKTLYKQRAALAPGLDTATKKLAEVEKKLASLSKNPDELFSRSVEETDNGRFLSPPSEIPTSSYSQAKQELLQARAERDALVADRAVIQEFKKLEQQIDALRASPDDLFTRTETTVDGGQYVVESTEAAPRAGFPRGAELTALKAERAKLMTPPVVKTTAGVPKPTQEEIAKTITDVLDRDAEIGPGGYEMAKPLGSLGRAVHGGLSFPKADKYLGRLTRLGTSQEHTLYSASRAVRKLTQMLGVDNGLVVEDYTNAAHKGFTVAYYQRALFRDTGLADVVSFSKKLSQGGFLTDTNYRQFWYDVDQVTTFGKAASSPEVQQMADLLKTFRDREMTYAAKAGHPLAEAGRQEWFSRWHRQQIVDNRSGFINDLHTAYLKAWASEDSKLIFFKAAEDAKIAVGKRTKLAELTPEELVAYKAALPDTLLKEARSSTQRLVGAPEDDTVKGMAADPKKSQRFSLDVIQHPAMQKWRDLDGLEYAVEQYGSTIASIAEYHAVMDNFGVPGVSLDDTLDQVQKWLVKRSDDPSEAIKGIRELRNLSAFMRHKLASPLDFSNVSLDTAADITLATTRAMKGSWWGLAGVPEIPLTIAKHTWTPDELLDLIQMTYKGISAEDADSLASVLEFYRVHSRFLTETGGEHGDFMFGGYLDSLKRGGRKAAQAAAGGGRKGRVVTDTAEALGSMSIEAGALRQVTTAGKMMSLNLTMNEVLNDLPKLVKIRKQWTGELTEDAFKALAAKHGMDPGKLAFYNKNFLLNDGVAEALQDLTKVKGAIIKGGFTGKGRVINTKAIALAIDEMAPGPAKQAYKEALDILRNHVEFVMQHDIATPGAMDLYLGPSRHAAIYRLYHALTSFPRAFAFRNVQAIGHFSSAKVVAALGTFVTADMILQVGKRIALGESLDQIIEDGRKDPTAFMTRLASGVPWLGQWTFVGMDVVNSLGGDNSREIRPIDSAGFSTLSQLLNGAIDVMRVPLGDPALSDRTKRTAMQAVPVLGWSYFWPIYRALGVTPKKETKKATGKATFEILGKSVNPYVNYKPGTELVPTPKQ